MLQVCAAGLGMQTQRPAKMLEVSGVAEGKVGKSETERRN